MRRGLVIGMIGQGWAPDLGGVESHTRELAHELVRRGHRVHALALDTSEGLEPYSLAVREHEGVEVTRLAYRYHDHRALADLVRNPRAETAAARWLAERRLQLVHVHHASGFGLGILPALRAAGAALVMTLHDYWALCPRGQMLRTDGEPCERATSERCAPCIARTWPHLMPSGHGEPRGPDGGAAPDDEAAALARTEYALRCLAAAHRLVTPSAAARAAYVAAGIAADVAVVENGVEVAELAREVGRLRATRTAEPGRELRLGVLGSVLPSKGALELARALIEAGVPELVLEVHGNLPSYHGDTRYVDELRALAAREPRVRIRGPYAHTELAAILAGLDGVAAPSRWNEVYGLTVREARAVGLPVLVSSAGALPDVVEHGAAGLVVPADDRAAWIDALRKFADPAQRAAWGGAATPPRSTRELALELERVYVDALRRAGKRRPRLEFEPGEERREARGVGAWLRRWLGGGAGT